MIDTQISQSERDAVARLFSHPEDDLEQGPRVRSFILAWWSSVHCGVGFDMRDAYDMEETLRADIVSVFSMVLRTGECPQMFGLAMEPFVRRWRPAVAAEIDQDCQERAPIRMGS